MTEADARNVQLLLDNQLCFKLYAASRAMIRGYRPMLEQLGLTYPQYLVLMVLWEWQAQPPLHATVKALGERLRLDSGTLTPLLKRLEQQGLVLRRRSTLDEREVLLELTQQGLALRERVPPLRDRLLCSSGLDQQQLFELAPLLDQLLSQLGER
jgi:DNA-binding MarR family transcriptional regulator